MEIITTLTQIGAGLGLGIAAVVVVPMLVFFALLVFGGAAGLTILAVLFAAYWCEDRWEDFKRRRLG